MFFLENKHKNLQYMGLFNSKSSFHCSEWLQSVVLLSVSCRQKWNKCDLHRNDLLPLCESLSNISGESPPFLKKQALLIVLNISKPPWLAPEGRAFFSQYFYQITVKGRSYFFVYLYKRNPTHSLSWCFRNSTHLDG